MTEYQKQKKIKEDYYIVNLESAELPLDFKKLFGNENSVHLDIGCGKGEFISQASKNFKDINFLGLELRLKRVYNTFHKLNTEDNPNVRLAALHVNEKILDYIKENSVDVVHVQHPDPWPKRKHFKNRIMQSEFISAVHKILKPGGLFKIATDHPEYAEWIQKKFACRRDFDADYIGKKTEKMLENHVETYYEKKWAKAGFEPIFMYYKKHQHLS